MPKPRCREGAVSAATAAPPSSSSSPSSSSATPAAAAAAAGPLFKPRWQDHPLVAWALENGTIVTLAKLRIAMGEAPYCFSAHAFPKTFLHALAGALLVIEGSIGAQHLLIHHVYAHRPFFTEASRRRAEHTPWQTQLSDWLRCNLPVHFFGAALYATIFTRLLTREQVLTHLSKTTRRQPFRLGPFLGRLAVVRVVADGVFYGVHRLLHTPPLYRLLHKRHHEHLQTALPTNFHFTVTDLLLEGFVPFFAGLSALERLEGQVCSPFEHFLLIAYIQWYEIGSHSGKSVPTVTYFPPLAPLYQAALRWLGGGWLPSGSSPNGRGLTGEGGTMARSVDARNVAFHDDHHRLSRGNYGITQWIDYLLGTNARPSSARARKSADDNH